MRRKKIIKIYNRIFFYQIIKFFKKYLHSNISFLYYFLLLWVLFLFFDSRKLKLFFGLFKVFWSRIRKYLAFDQPRRPALPLLNAEQMLILKLKVSNFATQYGIVDLDNFLLKFVADVRECNSALKRCAKSGLVPKHNTFYKSRDGYMCIPYYLRGFHFRWGGERLFKLDSHKIFLSRFTVGELTPYAKSVLADATAGLYI
jgi:hypothetical protein